MCMSCHRVIAVERQEPTRGGLTREFESTFERHRDHTEIGYGPADSVSGHKGVFCDRCGTEGPYDRMWDDAGEEQLGDDRVRELLADLQQLADEGERPTARDMQERGTHAVATYIDRFGSWGEALAAAGFDPSQRVTTEALLAELRRLHDEYEGRPTTTVAREHGTYSPQAYYNRFDSWDDALDAALETVPEDAADKSDTGQEYSDEELLDEIRRVADVADAEEAPSIPEFNKHSDIADSTVHRRFGSWNAGVEQAGFEPRQIGPTISDDDLVA